MIFHKVREFLVDRFTGRKAKNFEVRDEIMTLPNMVTIVGILWTFIYIVMYSFEISTVFIPILVVLIFLTDALDGLFADLFDQHSKIGKLLDRFRDRFMIGAMLLNGWLLSGNEVLTPILIVFAVEIFWLFEVVRYQNRYGRAPETHCLGKIRTFLQGIVLWIMIAEAYWVETFSIGVSVLLWAAAFMSIIAVSYNHWKMILSLQRMR